MQHESATWGWASSVVEAIYVSRTCQHQRRPRSKGSSPPLPRTPSTILTSDASGYTGIGASRTFYLRYVAIIGARFRILRGMPLPQPNNADQCARILIPYESRFSRRAVWPWDGIRNSDRHVYFATGANHSQSPRAKASSARVCSRPQISHRKRGAESRRIKPANRRREGWMGEVRKEEAERRGTESQMRQVAGGSRQ